MDEAESRVTILSGASNAVAMPAAYENDEQKKTSRVILDSQRKERKWGRALHVWPRYGCYRGAVRRWRLTVSARSARTSSASVVSCFCSLHVLTWVS